MAQRKGRVKIRIRKFGGVHLAPLEGNLNRGLSGGMQKQ